VLGDLSTKFPQEVLQNLFVKLQAVPLSNWDLQLVDLARSLFQPMVQRSSNSVGFLLQHSESGRQCLKPGIFVITCLSLRFITIVGGRILLFDTIRDPLERFERCITVSEFTGRLDIWGFYSSGQSRCTFWGCTASFRRVGHRSSSTR
jgi:hypothetical protein